MIYKTRSHATLTFSILSQALDLVSTLNGKVKRLYQDHKPPPQVTAVAKTLYYISILLLAFASMAFLEASVVLGFGLTAYLGNNLPQLLYYLVVILYCGYTSLALIMTFKVHELLG